MHVVFPEPPRKRRFFSSAKIVRSGHESAPEGSSVQATWCVRKRDRFRTVWGCFGNEADKSYRISVRYVRFKTYRYRFGSPASKCIAFQIGA